MKLSTWAALSALGLFALACDDDKESLDEEKGVAPPPVASSKPGACTSGGGKATDEVAGSFFPRVAGDYCIDPNGETRAYGKQAKGTVDEVCTELFDGECEVYKAYGLERVVTLRYIDGKGSPGAININLSRFDSKGGAYGFFTKRVIADADPVEAAPAKLDAGGAGALGTGIAYVWRGSYVAELSYTNELEPPAKLKTSSLRVLPPVAKQLGKNLPGDVEPPPAVGALPTANRVPMGIRYSADDVLDISGTGAGAVGFYKDGDKRWRVLTILREDEATAKDVLETFSKLEGAKKLENLTFAARSFTRQEGEVSPKVEWVVAQKGKRLVGIGDEEYVLSPDLSDAEAAKLGLDRKAKIERLKALLGDGAEAAKE